MRPINSTYDTATAESRSSDPGAARYALVSDHNGPCSVVAEYTSLAEAIEAARHLDTDAAPTELEDELGVCCDDTQTGARDLIAAAESAGWRHVASAPAGEHWDVLVAPAEAVGDVGHLPEDWIGGCRQNEGPDSTLEDWIGQIYNCTIVEVTDDGSVWIEGPQSGSWLSQDDCDQLRRAIDRGV